MSIISALALFLVFLGGFLAGAIFFRAVWFDLLRSEAIERGFARFHPQTGAWEWIVPAEVKP